MSKMAGSHLILLYFYICGLVASLDASEGDAYPIYKVCLEKCEKSGCVGEKCFQHCKFYSDGKSIDGLWYLQAMLHGYGDRYGTETETENGLNMKVCMAMGVAQVVIWGVWADVTNHPSRWKVWLFNVGGILAVLLEIYDFPPYKGFLDAHALWHAAYIPLSYLCWSFVRDDAEFRTLTLLKKMK
ncbi:hypothetical protein F3Y22_tig00009024pilonHSYRG00025 [Hibiscus syriacus]|uniref:Post-GPI attachment to proteins factor 3 n=1 Tax=Hibiscus syriacus TaxID=106335 RepID=A0A6A3CCV8_HIBSY|nr:hypothetical protein F3Y22_tig00009024pilonHSYRG00025 [Hibiscus syriacus]